MKSMIVFCSAVLLATWPVSMSPACTQADGSQKTVEIEPRSEPTQLMGQRFLTLNTIVRVHQIEVTRDIAHGPDESSVHTVAEARTNAMFLNLGSRSESK